MASAMLMLLNPRRYGVIDIRVWQLLHALGAVTKKPRGTGFNFKNWYQFLRMIRYFAKRHGVNARDIERTLFLAHQRYQKGKGTISPGLQVVGLRKFALAAKNTKKESNSVG